MCKHHMNCVHHLHGNACTSQIKWIIWTACNMCFGLISVLLYLGIQFHFHMVVFIPFNTKKAKNWHFFLVQNFFSQTASISLAMTVNTHQLDLSKAETFMGTILFGHQKTFFGRQKFYMVAKTFLASNYYVYVVLNIIAQSGVLSNYQIATTMIMEVVDSGYRSRVMMFTWLIW